MYDIKLQANSSWLSLLLLGQYLHLLGRRSHTWTVTIDLLTHKSLLVCPNPQNFFFLLFVHLLSLLQFWLFFPEDASPLPISSFADFLRAEHALHIKPDIGVYLKAAWHKSIPSKGGQIFSVGMFSKNKPSSVLGNPFIFITTFSWLKQQFKPWKAYLNKHAIDPKKEIIIFSYGGISATVNMTLDIESILSSYNITEKKKLICIKLREKRLGQVVGIVKVTSYFNCLDERTWTEEKYLGWIIEWVCKR